MLIAGAHSIRQDNGRRRPPIQLAGQTETEKSPAATSLVTLDCVVTPLGKPHRTFDALDSIETMTSEAPALGIGYYTAAEAARLLKEPAQNINRWLGGYAYRQNGKTCHMPPLWRPQLAGFEHHIELGFRDLIELRFVRAFLDAGLGLKTVRHCLDYARECVDDERPFSTRRFRTDGRTIFLESARDSGEAELLDLKNKQYIIRQVIERTFKDLDIEADTVARWRPFAGKNSIVIDPERVFGQPVANKYGVPTVALAQAVEAEGSVKRVSQLYEVPMAVIRDAVAFEKSLVDA